MSNSNNSRHQSNESEIDEQKADMADGYAMVNLNNVKVLEEKNTNSKYSIIFSLTFSHRQSVM